jgi:hypothetical protein
VVSPAEKRQRDEELRAWVEEQATIDRQVGSSRGNSLIGRFRDYASHMGRRK